MVLVIEIAVVVVVVLYHHYYYHQNITIIIITIIKYYHEKILLTYQLILRTLRQTLSYSHMGLCTHSENRFTMIRRTVNEESFPKKGLGKKAPENPLV